MKRKASKAVEQFRKEEEDALESFDNNRERYDIYLRYLKRAESWDELPELFSKMAIELNIDDPQWLENNLDCGPLYTLEKEIRNFTEARARCNNDYRRHRCDREIYMLQLAHKKLKEILKPVVGFSSMSVEGAHGGGKASTRGA